MLFGARRQHGLLFWRRQGDLGMRDRFLAASSQGTMVTQGILGGVGPLRPNVQDVPSLQIMPTPQENSV